MLIYNEKFFFHFKRHPTSLNRGAMHGMNILKFSRPGLLNYLLLLCLSGLFVNSEIVQINATYYLRCKILKFCSRASFEPANLLNQGVTCLRKPLIRRLFSTWCRLVVCLI